jgi:pimeloyl-ACP methyl ester carboxylesterase
VILAVLATLVILNVSRRADDGAIERRTDAAFYTLPTRLPAAAPGQIIRRERMAGAPLGATAWRVIYHSRDQAGRDIPVSGIVVVPDTLVPKGGRTIVSWAHPTTGSAPQCAPSRENDPFFAIEGLHELLASGYVIAATDYPGMGVAGPSSYLLGVPESNSVLDAARAARNIVTARAGHRLVLWGHSQGGQAALIAAERAAVYAPELKLEGVAVAAPAADLNALMTDDIVNVSGVTIASYAVPAYEAAYADTYSQAQIDAILTPAGAAATPKMAALCLLSQNKQIHAIAEPLIGGYVTSDPATTEPWQTMLRQNSAGGSPIDVPVYVGQGLADKLVIPSATRQYVHLLCSQGADVAFHQFGGITHALAAYASIPSLIPWLAEVDRGARPASTC